MTKYRKKTFWIIVASTIIAMNILVIVIVSSPQDDSSTAHAAPSQAKEQSPGTGPNPVTEPTEVHEDVEGPVPEDEGKG